MNKLLISYQFFSMSVLVYIFMCTCELVCRPIGDGLKTREQESRNLFYLVWV